MYYRNLNDIDFCTASINHLPSETHMYLFAPKPWWFLTDLYFLFAILTKNLNI